METIQSIMTKKVITVTPQTTLRDAVSLLIEHKITGLPVVDANNKVQGILSEKDFLKAFYQETKTVESLMTPKPVMVHVDDDLVKAFDILMANSFRRILVHDGGKLVGLISRSDLMPIVLEVLLDRS